MPITVKVTDKGLGFLMKGEGLVTGKEILDGIDERFSSEEKIRRYVYGISDYTEVEDIEMSGADVKLVAEKDMQVAKINPNLVIAIAAPKDIMYGLSRMFEAHAYKTGWVIGVYRSLEEAQKSVLDNLKNTHPQIGTITFEEFE